MIKAATVQFKTVDRASIPEIAIDERSPLTTAVLDTIDNGHAVVLDKIEAKSRATLLARFRTTAKRRGLTVRSRYIAPSKTLYVWVIKREPTQA